MGWSGRAPAPASERKLGWGTKQIEEAAKARGHLLQHSPHPIPIMQERVDYRRASENGKGAWEIGGNKDLKGEIEKIWEAMASGA
jgi:hypothetical protein